MRYNLKVHVISELNKKRKVMIIWLNEHLHGHCIYYYAYRMYITLIEMNAT